MRVEFDEEEKVWEFRVIFDADTDDTAMRCLEALSEAVVRCNMSWFNETMPDAPCCLGDAGVAYVLPVGCPGSDSPCQTIRGAAEILEEQQATCIDIACYMAGLLRLRGTPARVVLENMLVDGEPVAGEYHVLVQTDAGVIDYTQDLIEGDIGPCSIDCASFSFIARDPSTFDPSTILPE